MPFAERFGYTLLVSCALGVLLILFGDGMPDAWGITLQELAQGEKREAAETGSFLAWLREFLGLRHLVVPARGRLDRDQDHRARHGDRPVPGPRPGAHAALRNLAAERDGLVLHLVHAGHAAAPAAGLHLRRPAPDRAQVRHLHHRRHRLRAQRGGVQRRDHPGRHHLGRPQPEHRRQVARHGPDADAPAHHHAAGAPPHPAGHDERHHQHAEADVGRVGDLRQRADLPRPSRSSGRTSSSSPCSRLPQ